MPRNARADAFTTSGLTADEVAIFNRISRGRLDVMLASAIWNKIQRLFSEAHSDQAPAGLNWLNFNWISAQVLVEKLGAQEVAPDQLAHAKLYSDFVLACQKYLEDRVRAEQLSCRHTSSWKKRGLL